MLPAPSPHPATPPPQTQHQRSAAGTGWQVKQAGGLFGAGGTTAVVMEAAGSMAAGEPVAMDFGPNKTGVFGGEGEGTPGEAWQAGRPGQATTRKCGAPRVRQLLSAGQQRRCVRGRSAAA